MKLYVSRKNLKRAVREGAFSKILIDDIEGEIHIRHDGGGYAMSFSNVKFDNSIKFFYDNGVYISYSKDAIRCVRKALRKLPHTISLDCVSLIPYTKEDEAADSGTIRNPPIYRPNQEGAFEFKHPSPIGEVNVRLTPIHGAVAENYLNTPSETDTDNSLNTTPQVLNDFEKDLANKYMGNLEGPVYFKDGVKMVRTTKYGDITLEELNDKIRCEWFDKTYPIVYKKLTELSDVLPDGAAESLSERLADAVNADKNCRNEMLQKVIDDFKIDIETM